MRLKLGDVIPVDYELAAETLKRADQKVYDFYKKITTEGLSGAEIKSDYDNFQKCILFLTSVDKLNALEQDGFVKILNDYSQRRVIIKRTV